MPPRKNQKTRTLILDQREILKTRNQLVAITPDRFVVTMFPIDATTKFAPLNDSMQVVPGGSITRYCSGPGGATVTMSLSRIQNSGGHLHSGGPVGTVTPSTFQLPSHYPQNIPNVFMAPEASGTIQQLVQAAGQTVLHMNQVGYTGFVQLTPGVGIVLTGSTPSHPGNHFGLPQLISKIQQLATAFHSQFNKALFVNDCSLEHGGLYDFTCSWTPPHATHREGRTADINSTSMDQQEKDFFRHTAQNLGFAVTLEATPPHWHLSI